MEDFTTYRRRNGYSEKSIKGQNWHINHFKNWCSEQNINPEMITYNQALQFIDSERERGMANPSIINETGSVRIYFDYLVETGRIRQNIIKRIKIRKSPKKALPETLTLQQLENVYQNFLTLPEWEHPTKTVKELHKRNIVVLGLLVYQGITSGETAKLETNHINLMEGKVYIPATRKGNARTLKLQANQILPLKNYLDELTPHQYLFPTKKHTDLVINILKQVKKQNPEIINSRQIRTSVIMNWLKSNNIRQVQYMAGHRSIKSTEEYRNQDLTDLSKQLELFHPLR
jgi:integrase/recombinase XerD